VFDKVKPETKGDWAVVLLAGSLGYTLDAGLNIIGFLEPGICGTLFATTALGLKKGYEATTDPRRQSSAEETERTEEVERTRSTIQFFDAKGHPGVGSDLRDVLELAEIRHSTAEELRSAVDQVLEKHGITGV
jgi:hypothetical protein